MFFEALLHLLELDLGWFIYIALTNLHYLFAFATVMYIFRDYKSMWYGLILLTFAVWGYDKLPNFTGMVIWVGGFLAIYYITKIIVLMLAEDHPIFKKHLFLISGIQLWITLIVYNVWIA